MARNPSSKQRNVVQPEKTVDAQRTNQYSHEFVNVYLNAGDVAWLSEHEADAYDVVGGFLDKVSSGYEYTVREDPKSLRWNAMLKCSDEQLVNNGLILSVRAATSFDALYALAYAVTVKLPDAWRDSANTGNSRFN